MPSSVDPSILARQRARQLSAWTRQFKAGKTEGIPKKLLATLGSSPTPDLSSAPTESSDRPLLSRSQIKNRSKRLRKQRPCHRCGQPGHKKSSCSQDSSSVDKEETICFACRSFGHLLRDCPNVDQTKKSAKCYQCGSDQHAARDCKMREQEQIDHPVLSSTAYPLAVCFVCGSQGHLSRDCPSSDHGIFPKGGQCKRCGRSDHKVKNCSLPETEEEKEQKKIEKEERKKRTRESKNTSESIDGNVQFEELEEKKSKKQKKSNKEEKQENEEEDKKTKEKKPKKTAKLVKF
jgi:hypothetical protein